MADYQTSVRTNYFKVKDEELFLEFMSRVVVEGDDIELLLSTDDRGEPMYGFATHGLIIGIPGSYDETEEADAKADTMFDDFVIGLQEIVAPGDAIIILEVGDSELSDVYAAATIVTEEETDYIDLRDLATERAVDLLSTRKFHNHY